MSYVINISLNTEENSEERNEAFDIMLQVKEFYQTFVKKRVAMFYLNLFLKRATEIKLIPLGFYISYLSFISTLIPCLGFAALSHYVF